MCRARHQARQGRDHPGHSGSSARKPCATSTRVAFIRIGAYVRPQDILVGKITPKGETQLSQKRSSSRHLRREGWRRSRHLSGFRRA